jgi:hypothetical protein
VLATFELSTNVDSIAKLAAQQGWLFPLPSSFEDKDEQEIPSLFYTAYDSVYTDSAPAC